MIKNGNIQGTENNLDNTLFYNIMEDLNSLLIF